MGMIKTRMEIAKLKRAAGISNSCIPIIERALREDGMTERELARRVRRNIYRQGGRLSFRTLVGSGARSAMIHTKPSVTDNVISGIGYIDFGASWKGYKTDVTVPFIKGRVSAKEKKIVKVVQDAYRLACRIWKVGMPCWEFQEKVYGYVGSRKLWMGHSVGHGVGLKIHENPKMYGKPRKKLDAKKAKRWERIKKIVFEENMAFTIEPGAYAAGLGGSRIENTFLASGKRLKRLTNSKLIEV